MLPIESNALEFFHMAIHVWTVQVIETEKAALRQEFNDWLADGGHERALQKVVDRLTQGGGNTSTGRLRIYILGIYGLIAQRDSGLLTPTQYLRFADSCRTALTLQGIDPEHSTLAYMYADVHALLGQISTESGQHWAGVWHQLSASRFLRNANDSTLTFQNFTTAQRLLRLGQIEAAESLLDGILAASGTLAVSDAVYAPTLMNQLLIFRLKDEHSKAEALSHDGLSSTRLNDEALQQLQWEAMCREATSKLNLDPMYKAVAKGGSHHLPVYLVLATLWDLALGTNALWRKGVKLSKVSAKERKRYRSIGALFEITLALQELCDTEVPSHIRLDRIGQALETAGNVRTIDQELLIWLAAGKMLKRMHYGIFSGPCYFEYQQISLRISGGTCSDLLRGLGSEKTEEKKLKVAS